MKKFSWSKTHPFSAQRFGEWLDRQTDKTAEGVIKASKNPLAPAHKFLFGQSDKDMAQRHRLLLARTMIQSVEYEIVTLKGKPQTINAYIGTVGREGTTIYVSMDKATRAQLSEAEKQFLKHIRRLEKRFKHLKMAVSVIQAINDTLKTRKTKAA